MTGTINKVSFLVLLIYVVLVCFVCLFSFFFASFFIVKYSIKKLIDRC